MSRSPFLEVRSSRLARRRRRRLRLARRAAAAIVLLAVLGGAAFAVLRGGTAKHPSRSVGPQLALGPPARPTLPRTGGAALLHVQLADTASVNPRFRHQPRAGLLVDLDTGHVLWQRNATQVLPIASLTKMMTALLVAERTRTRDRVLITKEALAYRGSGVGVLPRGKLVSRETLLYGLLLPSGNDAAIALAQHISGSVAAFVNLMNETARRLGLGCTHYVSPDGFEDTNVSCAADLARLARADLDNRQVARVARARSAALPLPIKSGRVFLYNNNPLVRLRFPGITGLKTGETLAAGLCLVATAERHGVRLASILLHSPSLAAQSERLLTLGFRAEAGTARSKT